MTTSLSTLITLSKIDSADHPYRWHFVYLHGEIEGMTDGEGETPDIAYFNIDKPEPGIYQATYQDEPVIIRLVGIHGRVCLLDDLEALRETVGSADDW